MKILKYILIFVMVVSFSAISKPLAIKYFSKKSEFSQVQISPSGKYISAVTNNEGKKVLAIFDRKTLKMIHVVYFNNRAQVGTYNWVNNERLVIAKTYFQGWNDHPLYYGELFAVNADGTKEKYLMGYNSERQTGSNIKKTEAIFGFSYVLDPLLEDDKHMLAYVLPANKNVEPSVIVYKVNLFSGRKKKVTRSPARMARYLTDHQGEVRFAIASSDYIQQDLYERNLESNEWIKKTNINSKYFDITPFAFDESGEKVYVTASQKTGPKGLFLLDLKTSDMKLISQDKRVSPSNVWINKNTRSLYAVEYEPGYPTYEFIDKNSYMSKRLKGLIKALPGHQVRILSTTQDNSAHIIWAGNDRNPGDYYLYDAVTKKLQYLLSSKNWIDPDKMAEVRPISYEARDGLVIDGYLTLPLNKKEKKLPLVVMPHGGPHGPRDWWGFDSDTQLLANNNIAVLQVNFRGSGGYGSDFEHKGHQKWGAEIQYDIIDGVNYLVEQGIADKENICIMGASFGGYSALQSSIIEPDMFKCAIGVVGVYDLPLMYSTGDVQERKTGINYLTRVLGEDNDQLKSFSPANNVDKLKAPVLIVHGGTDERAPMEQADSLISALKKENHPYEYMELSEEGHGFYKDEHREEYYKKVLEFLGKHISF